MRLRRITRDGVLFTGGLAGVAWQTVVEKAERPTLLLLYAAMMGLPAFLALDEAKKSHTAPPPTAPPPPAPTSDTVDVS